MTEFEILENPETYVNLINLYRNCKSKVDLTSSYKYIDIEEEQEVLKHTEKDQKLIDIALLISCGYSISMLGGDPNILKPSKSR